MILIHYPSPNKTKKKPTVSTTTELVPLSSTPGGERYEYGDMARAARLGISDMEFKRRCALVLEAWKKCPLLKDDVVYPVNAQDYQHYGAMRVVGVASDYRNMLETEWPKNDNPFILCLTSIAGQAYTTFATAGWASKTNHHLKLSGEPHGNTPQTC